MAVRLHLLGPPAVEWEGDSLALPFERRAQLLAFLALKRAWIGRAELAAMLWPDHAGKLAQANLRKTLFRAQSLPWAATLETRGGALRFDAQTDVFAFESALREKRFGEAVGLWRGEFLDGFDDGESEAWSGWLAFERERLRSAWRNSALNHLSGDDIGASDAIALSTRLLEADPLDESALQAHMSWLARGGQAAQARQAYRTFAARLSQDLGVAPGSTLQALNDSLAGNAAPVRVATTTSSGDESFVGRSVELRQISSLLAQPQCRLVCMIGPGGAGKTRLARRAILDLAPRHADGIAFVALEEAGNAADIVASIARELAVVPARGRDPFEHLAEYLRDSDMLIALDNFEHLAGEAKLLERLLTACPRLKLLVTSRVRLGLASEQLLPLEGLPCPEAEDQDRIESFDAARLFANAARRLDPAFVPDIEAASIVEICRQVEGLPLALELAAAWTRVMSCEAIAAQLAEGAQLLQTGDATQPARHASMEMVFDQSWRLLSAVERGTLERVSIFQGGFSLEAAKTVANASPPVLGALVDKSLLRKEHGRLHMHPLVHRFASARLANNSASEETERAHATHFNRFMARVARDIEHGDREALKAMDMDWNNCRTAWRWSLAHDIREQAARSMPAMLHFCDHRGRIEEGLAILREAGESDAARTDRKLHALVLSSIAHLQYRLDRYAEAEGNALRALEATEPGDQARLQCLRVLAGCCLRLGRFEDARRYYQQALKLTPASIDPGTAAALLDNLALVAKYRGEYSESLKLSHQSLVQHRLIENAAGEALCLNNLGAMELDVGEIDSARAHLGEGLAVCERHGLSSTQALVHGNLTQLALHVGDWSAGERHARRSLEAAEATGQRGLSCAIQFKIAQLALRRGDSRAAHEGLAAAMQVALAIGRPVQQLEGLLLFAEILAADGNTEAARRLLAFAAAQESAPALVRDMFRQQLAGLPPSDTSSPWPGLSLDEVLRRIAIERDVAHAPLVAAIAAT
jgi:predicted ATPase/DNA-binding SARP family transcriptional activator